MNIRNVSTKLTEEGIKQKKLNIHVKYRSIQFFLKEFLTLCDNYMINVKQLMNSFVKTRDWKRSLKCFFKQSR